MNRIISRGLMTVLVTGGFLALGAGVAYADDSTDGSDGTLSGTQGLLGIDLPITVGGNAISVLGDSSSSGSSTSGGSGGSSSSGTTSGTNSLLGGTQGIVGGNVPVTIGGNAISVIGDSSSEDSSFEGASGSGEGGTASTSGKDGILGGTQIAGDAVAPVTVSGNAISVAGDSYSGQSGTVSSSDSDAAGTSGTTSGDDSLAGGTQVLADGEAPVVVGGNAISVIGDSSTEGSTTANGSGEGSGAGDSATTDGSDGIASGSQIVASPWVPVTAGGNAISVVGDSSSSGSDTSSPIAGGGSDATTSGDDGAVSGTQLVVGPSVPVTVGGNAISIIGDSTVDNPGEDDNDVGGETVTPPGVVTPAGVGGVAALLAATGSDLLVPTLALAMLLLAAGVTFMIRTRTARR